MFSNKAIKEGGTVTTYPPVLNDLLVQYDTEPIAAKVVEEKSNFKQRSLIHELPLKSHGT